MRTLEFTHPANSTTTLWSNAPGLLAPWTAERIDDEVAARISADGKHIRRSMWLQNPLPLRVRHAPAPQTPHRWGVVLAGGDGTRMRELTQWVYGDDRPKQFCALLGGRTLLEQARQRAERSIPADRILFSLTRAHESYYRRYLAGGPAQRIVQPFNRGTAPAILSALARISQADPNAIVSVLPSDHYYSSETAFSANLDSAFHIAEHRPESLVLLGAEPTEPETQYGWIEVGETVGGRPELFRVEGFREKPPLAVAQALLRRGALWNTFVIVGRVRAFLEIAWATVPRLMDALESQRIVPGPGAEIRIPDSVYHRIDPVDFSRQILALAPSRLLAFQLKNIAWSDLGDPYRVLSTLLETTGHLPEWATLWQAYQPTVCAQAA